MPTVKDKNTGKVISRQPYNNQGTQTAASIANSNPNWEASYDTNDARSRSEVNQAGSGKTGYSNIGVQSDSTWYGAPKIKDIMQPVDEYEKGGKTKKNKKDGFVKKIVDKVKFNKSINREKRQQIKDIKSKLKDDRKIAQDYRDKVRAAYEGGNPKGTTQKETDEAIRAHLDDLSWLEKREKIASVKKAARKAKRKGKKNPSLSARGQFPSAYKKGGLVKKVVKGIDKVADKAWEGVDKVTRGGVAKLDKKLGKWMVKREKITKIKKTARKLKQKARREQTMGLTDFKTRRQKKKDINVRKKELIKEIKNK